MHAHEPGEIYWILSVGGCNVENESDNVINSVDNSTSINKKSSLFRKVNRRRTEIEEYKLKAGQIFVQQPYQPHEFVCYEDVLMVWVWTGTVNGGNYKWL